MHRFQGLKIPRIEHNAIDLTEQSLAYQDAHPIPFATDVTKNRDYEKLLLQNELNTTIEYKTFYVRSSSAITTYTFDTDVQNVASIEITSVTLPNVQPTVNLGNNTFYWVNQEDIDNKYVTMDKDVPSYPVYAVSIRPGNYGIDTLISRLSDAIQRIPRNNATKTKHYFVFETDYSTSNIEIHNLDIFPVLQIATTAQSSLVTVTLTDALVGTPLVAQEQVYIFGAQTFNGISSTLLNGNQNIVTVLSDTSFVVDVGVPATQTGHGGGSYVRMGRNIAFKLLAGDYYSASLFKSLGFPPINSMMMIGTQITSVRNVSLALLVNYETPGVTSSLFSDTAVSGDTDGYLVESMKEGALAILNNNLSGTASLSTAAFGTQTTYVEPRNVSCFMITTADAHNYTSRDAGSSVTINGSQTIGQKGLRYNSGFDGTYTILYVVSATRIVVRGTCPIYADLANYDLGTLNTPNPFTTASFFVAAIAPNNTDLAPIGVAKSAKITIAGMDPDYFAVGDTVTLYNKIVSTASTTNLAILQVDTASSCIYTANLPNVSFEDGVTTISSNVLTLRLPNHGVAAVNTVITNLDGTFRVNFTNRTLASFAAGDQFYTQTSNAPYIVTQVDSTFVYCYQSGPSPVAPGGVLMLSPKVQFLNETLSLVDCTFRSVLDADHVQINALGFQETRTPTALAKYGNTSGGDVIYVSSELHGFADKQNNDVGIDVYAPIDLSGPNQVYLQIPEIANLNTPKRPRPYSVADIDGTFAVINLGQPGSVSRGLDTQIIEFDPPMHLPSITLKLTNEDGTSYDLKHKEYTLGIRVGILTRPLALRPSEKIPSY